MNRSAITTEGAPAAIGTYSQAIRVGQLVFISGQIPLVPGSPDLVAGDITVRIRQVFSNLTAICEAAGSDLNHVVKFTVYLTDLANFAAVNQVMESLLNAPYPARAAVQVSALPKGADVEIDAILSLDA